jgi:hypothetical protein
MEIGTNEMSQTEKEMTTCIHCGKPILRRQGTYQKDRKFCNKICHRGWKFKFKVEGVNWSTLKPS